MHQAPTFNFQLYGTAAISILVWAFLAWDHFHGGVPSHHLLADKNLPAISNWWGGILIPVVSCWLLYRIKQGIAKRGSNNSGKSILYRFAGAIIFGIALSTCFTLEAADMAGYLVLSLLPIALFIPIYRSECLLGLILAMSYTFGTVLPLLIGSAFALISAGLYLAIRPATIYLMAKIRAGRTSEK